MDSFSRYNGDVPHLEREMIMKECSETLTKPINRWLRTVGRILLAVLIVIAGAAAVFEGVYFSRFQTMSSISKLSSYEDGYDLYRMDVTYNYDLDGVIARGIHDEQSMIDAMIGTGLPLLPVTMTAPDFGCSSFQLQSADGNYYMGRNYDFRTDTSGMLVYCAPKDGLSFGGVCGFEQSGGQ